MTSRSALFALVIMIGLAGVLGACTSREPIAIIVTPTAQDTPVLVRITPLTSDTVAAMPTDLPAANVPVIPTSTQRVAEGQVSRPTLTPTITPTVTPTPTLRDPDSIDVPYGPIIDEDYTVPPTSTPAPTATATIPPPSATVEQLPTATLPGITTPLPDVARLDRNEIGLQMYWNMGIASWEREVEMAAATNVGWVKVQADWSFLQPDGPNQFSQTFRLFENHMERVKREDVRLLISIAKAPDWAMNDVPGNLANFIRFMLYETKIGQAVDVIEIWNEPNLEREWVPTLPFNGAGYMQLFVPSYNTIMEFNGNNPFGRIVGVVSAALAPTSTLPGSVDDREYLQQMYNAGFGQYTQLGLGVHPYGWGNPPDARCCNAIPNRGWDDDPHFFFIHNLEEIRDIMVANGHAGVDMWVTEFGWNSWYDLPTEPPEPWMRYTTPEQQAEYTLRALEIAEELDWVGPMILWNFNFANRAVVEERNEIAGYSLIYPVFDDEGNLIERRARPLLSRLTEALRLVE